MEAALVEGSSQNTAFKGGVFKTVSDAWRHGLNQAYWTHGITISLGNDLSVSDRHARWRLNYIQSHLLKEIFGKDHEAKGAKIRFLGFKQGHYRTCNQHFHVLMAVEGSHNWSAQKIAETIVAIDGGRQKRNWEKSVHVDCDWTEGNRFHAYVSREATFNPDSVFVM